MKTIILFLLFPAFVFSQKLTPNKLADSLLKIEKINFANSESDSLNGRMDPFTEDAQITYSPDNRFKLLCTLGESCGAYCNPYNLCWIYVAQNNGTVTEKALEFIDPVKEIVLLRKTKTYTDYLVFTSNWCRPRGFEAGETWNFHHIRLQGDSIQFMKPIFTDENNSTWFYSSDVLCIEKENPGMWYNTKTKMITYAYYRYSDEENKCSFNKGSYKLVKGNYVSTKIISTETPVNNSY